MSADPSSRRILLVGPPSIHLERWRSLVGELGWSTVLVSYDDPHPDAVAHLPDVMAGGRAAIVARLLQGRSTLRRVIAEVDPDLVHAHWLTGPGWIAALAGARPLVVSAWGSDALRWTPQRRLGRLLGRFVGRRAAVVTYDAEAVADALAAVGVPHERLARVVIGADGRVFHPRERDSQLLERLGARRGAPVVLSPRGLDPVYRPETVVAAFARLAARRPATLLLRVADRDRALLPALLAQADRLGVADSVRTYEPVDEAELPLLLASADVVVSVPASDGTSVVLLETLATETPVVVSDLPANREWIPAGSPWVVPVGDDRALADALERVLADPQRARDGMRPLAEGVRARGDSRVQLSAIRELYARLLEETPPPDARGRR